MTLPGQMELATVIDHVKYPANVMDVPVSGYKPDGVRLAKLLHQYDNSPSSDLWRTIQALSYEILRDSK